jgi:hypothetical protein
MKNEVQQKLKFNNFIQKVSDYNNIFLFLTKSLSIQKYNFQFL